MKQPYQFIFNRLLPCLVAILIVFAVNSCRKDFNSSSGSTAATSINVDIATLKSIYESSIKSNGLSIQKNGNKHKLIHTLDVDWNTYTLQQRGDSSVVAEFDMKNDTGLYTLKQLTSDNSVNSKNKATAVFIKFSNGKRLNFFTKVIEDLSIPGSTSVMDSLHYNYIPLGFNGMIFYYTFNQEFINADRYINGVKTGKVSFNDTNTQTTNSIKDHSAPQPCTITDYYFYTCQTRKNADGSTTKFDCKDIYIGSVLTCPDDDAGPGGVDGDDSGGGGGNAQNPCVTNSGGTPVKMASVSGGHIKVNFVAPPSDGGGGTTTPNVPCPTAVTIKTDSLKKTFPCAVKLILDKLASIGLYGSFVQPFTTSQGLI